MDGSSLIFILMPIVIPLVLFTGVGLVYIADSRSGRRRAQAGSSSAATSSEARKTRSASEPMSNSFSPIRPKPSAANGSASARDSWPSAWAAIVTAL